MNAQPPDFEGEEVWQQKLEKKLAAAFADVRERAEADGVSYRDAAYRIAVRRVADAEELRGH